MARCQFSTQLYAARNKHRFSSQSTRVADLSPVPSVWSRPLRQLATNVPDCFGIELKTLIRSGPDLTRSEGMFLPYDV
jgi:hypothetical protein